MIQCLASPTLSLSLSLGAMSREGHCGHHENPIVLITVMIDRLSYEVGGEREGLRHSKSWEKKLFERGEENHR